MKSKKGLVLLGVAIASLWVAVLTTYATHVRKGVPEATLLSGDEAPTSCSSSSSGDHPE